MGSPTAAEAVEGVATVLQGGSHQSLTQHGSEDGQGDWHGRERPVARRNQDVTGERVHIVSPGRLVVQWEVF